MYMFGNNYLFYWKMGSVKSKPPPERLTITICNIILVHNCSVQAKYSEL